MNKPIVFVILLIIGVVDCVYFWHSNNMLRLAGVLVAGLSAFRIYNLWKKSKE